MVDILAKIGAVTDVEYYLTANVEYVAGTIYSIFLFPADPDLIQEMLEGMDTAAAFAKEYKFTGVTSHFPDLAFCDLLCLSNYYYQEFLRDVTKGGLGSLHTIKNKTQLIPTELLRQADLRPRTRIIESNPEWMEWTYHPDTVKLSAGLDADRIIQTTPLTREFLLSALDRVTA